MEDWIPGDGEGDEFVCDRGTIDCSDVVLDRSLGLCRYAGRDVAVLPSEKVGGIENVIWNLFTGESDSGGVDCVAGDDVEDTVVFLVYNSKGL